MILVQSYYEEDDSDEPQVETSNGTVTEVVKRFDYISIKELETGKVSKTKVELQAQGKCDGFYTFDISGTQEEIEGFLEAMYLEKSITWKAQFSFIPQVGLKCLRNSDNQVFFITQVNGQRINLCSTEGEIIQNLYLGKVKEDFQRAP